MKIPKITTGLRKTSDFFIEMFFNSMIKLNSNQNNPEKSDYFNKTLKYSCEKNKETLFNSLIMNKNIDFFVLEDCMYIVCKTGNDKMAKKILNHKDYDSIYFTELLFTSSRYKRLEIVKLILSIKRKFIKTYYFNKLTKYLFDYYLFSRNKHFPEDIEKMIIDN